MIFLTKADVLKIHRRAIAEHGGSEGIRDKNLLISALSAAENSYFYEEPTSQCTPRLMPIIFPKRTPLLTATKESLPFVPKFFY
ncbi:MAG: hypothetical protein M3521_03520 [Acidobacteriota bacterium]|nr:hypothetical protein [Acidobacteriota bacterium]